MGHGLLDDSDGSAHLRPVLRNAGGILVRDGAFVWTKLIGDVYENSPNIPFGAEVRSSNGCTGSG